MTKPTIEETERLLDAVFDDDADPTEDEIADAVAALPVPVDEWAAKIRDVCYVVRDGSFTPSYMAWCASCDGPREVDAQGCVACRVRGEQ